MIELSIVIPTLNEEANLCKLLLSISLQKDVAMEVIVADGGSVDRTCSLSEEYEPGISVLRGDPGRALQLNAGAGAAKGEFILFLHADSEFNDCFTLRRAVDALRRSAADNSGKPSAGHFAIIFGDRSVSRSLSYRILEGKARLNRKGCSHGDQGILIPAGLFKEYGGFDESCHVIAETRFADRLRENGQWLLLPAELTTSTRRFKKDGLMRRQVLNAVIMALGDAGQISMIDFSAGYAAAGSSSQLQLKPVLRKIAGRIEAFEEKERAEFWGKVGGYVCENAWQLPFWADIIIGSRARSGNIAKHRLLELYDRHFGGLADNIFAVRLAACASRICLKYMSGS
jgi:rSAM/selenodomain-associated transferase 2